MRIHFFEEFPHKRNLEKLRMVTWPAIVYIAAENLPNFYKIIKPYHQMRITFGYWPILKKEEGYWLSPFSKKKAIKRIILEIGKQHKIPLIMWDAELPLRHPWLFFRLDFFFTNRPHIKRFFKNYGPFIATSEYPLKSRVTGFFLRCLGVSFSPQKYGNKKIVMYYSSMHYGINSLLLKNIKKLHEQHGKNLMVGLGTIAHGILKWEPILYPDDLRKDLLQMKKLGIEEVVIFRLGGLNKEYVKVLKEFVDDK